MSFKSIKTKIRGLRRKAKRIEQWKQQFINLDIDSLLKYGKTYVKVWIPPFHNYYTISEYECDHKNPPNWFNRLILQAMIEIYQSWDAKLRELGQPYYLKIWLYDPRFASSQVVAAIGDSVEYYETLFSKDEKKTKFPSEKFKVLNININKFSWELYKDEFVIFESENLDDQRYLNFIKKKAYKLQEEKVLEQDEVCIYVRQGNVWVGSLE